MLPKSVRPERIRDFSEEALGLGTAALVEAGGAEGARGGGGGRAGWGLSVEQMRALDALEDGHKYCWDPSGIR